MAVEIERKFLLDPKWLSKIPDGTPGQLITQIYVAEPELGMATVRVRSSTFFVHGDEPNGPVEAKWTFCVKFPSDPHDLSRRLEFEVPTTVYDAKLAFEGHKLVQLEKQRYIIKVPKCPGVEQIECDVYPDLYVVFGDQILQLVVAEVEYKEGTTFSMFDLPIKDHILGEVTKDATFGNRWLAGLASDPNRTIKAVHFNPNHHG
jgi:CYTH domain-containing protein